MSTKQLIPISILMQFIGITIVGLGQAIPGMVVFSLGCLQTLLFTRFETKEHKIDDKLTEDVVALKHEVQNMQLAIGMR